MNIKRMHRLPATTKVAGIGAKPVSDTCPWDNLPESDLGDWEVGTPPLEDSAPYSVIGVRVLIRLDRASASVAPGGKIKITLRNGTCIVQNGD